MKNKSPTNLVIVESPTKARTISRFLGSDFVVDSSFGHIRDLPTSQLGVDVEKNFEPKYVIPRKAAPRVKKLKEEARRAERVILATDEDREGEAIAWHLVGGKKRTRARTKPKAVIARIVFHEITRNAIQEALKNPRDIDLNLVDAQQARRILDRLVGYKLSPFLWKKIYRGLSAGRVQSVAVRLIVEREREIQQFQKQEYWTVDAELEPQDIKNKKDGQFRATLVKINDKALEKFAIPNEEAARDITAKLENVMWRVAHIEQRAVQKNPFPPYTTSTLQQDAFRRLGHSAKQTMMLAQQLYEGLDLGERGGVGLITYMRTDSLNLSEEALRGAHEFLKDHVGEKYTLPTPRRYKTKSKGAQEAHEAIRPTDPFRTPDVVAPYLEQRQLELYELIWRRFIATQMPAAVFDANTIDVHATKENKSDMYTFRASGQILRFDGFLKVYPLKFTETGLPILQPDDPLSLLQLIPLQHFTEPPPRYTEASLVKALEKYGIGRPSTYAPTIATIQDRRYVERIERRQLSPTETGFLVNDLLVAHFPEIVDVQFTARIEEELDEIASGEKQWQPVIREFYEPFAAHLAVKYEEVEKQHTDEMTEGKCEKCGKPMVIKHGRFGRFLACSGFPECKNTKAIKKEPETIGMKCLKCGEGEIIKKFTKRKRLFFGCSRYPKCNFASWKDPRQKESEG
ncbi:MAG: DNA topoisomerase I [Parcubacteria group bacterium Gr01-1014_66]|nr:MAG: DNA topoisomerase I [Parcubacteria group bacterium Gr01-1014_66]